MNTQQAIQLICPDLEKVLEDFRFWKSGKAHFNEENPDEETCLIEAKEFGTCLCKDCYFGFRIREVMLETRLSCYKGELEFIKKLKNRKLREPPTKELFDKIISERKKCQICEKEETHSFDLHHIIPKRNGGSNNENNLLLICEECHRIIESMLYSGDMANRRIVNERIEALNIVIKLVEDVL